MERHWKGVWKARAPFFCGFGSFGRAIVTIRICGRAQARARAKHHDLPSSPSILIKKKGSPMKNNDNSSGDGGSEGFQSGSGVEGRPPCTDSTSEHVVLRTWSADAIFVWRRFIDDSGQRGINCAVFRNEGPLQSSDLIRQADAVADLCWPGARHYTFVDARKVRSANPGFCFLAAGWQRAGRTKGGLLVLDRHPTTRGTNK